MERFVTTADVELELFKAGTGAPMLFLHGAQGFIPISPMSGFWRSTIV